MQRNPEELYELGPAVPDLADAPMLHYLEGFIDAGNAGRLLAEHVLSSFPHETVARFDVDRLIDYRSRRPLMTYDHSRWENYEAPELSLHLLRDPAERPFLLLTGPEPDHEWDLFTQAVAGLAGPRATRAPAHLFSVPRPVCRTPARSGSSPTPPGRSCWSATSGCRAGSRCQAAPVPCWSCG